MKNKLEEYSVEELNEEIARRESNTKRPKPLFEPEINMLRELCETYLDNLENDEHNDDEQHYIFEAAMEAFYGKDVWKFINEKM